MQTDKDIKKAQDHIICASVTLSVWCNATTRPFGKTIRARRATALQRLIGMSASVYTIAIRNISDLESIYGQLTKGIAIN